MGADAAVEKKYNHSRIPLIESFKMSTMTAYLTLSVAAVATATAAVAAAVTAGPIMSDVRIFGASDEGKQSSLDRPSETKLGRKWPFSLLH